MARVFDPGARQSLRSFGRAAKPLRLFNTDTPGRRRRRKSAGTMVMAMVVAGIAAVLWSSATGGAQWLAIAPGVVSLLVATLGIRAALADQNPTVTCAGCGAVGWVEDVKGYGGRCPHCGATQFRAEGHWSNGSSGSGCVTGIELCSGNFAVDGDSADSGGGDGDGGGDGGGGD